MCVWRSDVAPRTKCKVVTPSQLAKIYAPKKFPKVLISRNAWVFEYDPDYITKTNPHAVGNDFGIVNDPYGRNPEWHGLTDSVMASSENTCAKACSPTKPLLTPAFPIAA